MFIVFYKNIKHTLKNILSNVGNHRELYARSLTQCHDHGLAALILHAVSHQLQIGRYKRRASLTDNPSANIVRYRGMSYILLIIPFFV